jgi:hypothetical protein
MIKITFILSILLIRQKKKYYKTKNAIINLSWTSNVPVAVKTALKKGKYASYYVNGIKEVKTLGETRYVLTIDNHGGSTMATEGYGSWEDYRITFDTNGALTNVNEL